MLKFIKDCDVYATLLFYVRSVYKKGEKHTHIQRERGKERRGKEPSLCIVCSRYSVHRI